MKYCLLGEKLSHSFSKEIHTKLGLDYSLREVSPCMIGDFALSREFAGYNVTIPYKKTITSFLDGVSNEVKSIGAVNTVKIKDGKSYGYNTDVLGFLYTVKRKGVNLSGKTVMVLGTGGASNAVKYGLEKENAKEIIIVGRNSEINYQNCYDKTEVEIIINATPVGTSPDFESKPIDLSKFSKLIAVFDLIYNPQKTALLKQAESLGLIYSNGLPMLVEQALCAQDIWLDKTHGFEVTEKLIEEISKKQLNICLVGMPSCGKSTIGKELSKALNREFIDLDNEIFVQTKKTPAEIIKESGEEYFREIETKILKQVICNLNAVISLGGGAFISEKNRELISQNAISVYIKRDLSLLETGGRPLSLEKGVETLYNERKEFYETASLTVENNGDITCAIKELIKKYETFSFERPQS